MIWFSKSTTIFSGWLCCMASNVCFRKLSLTTIWQQTVVQRIILRCRQSCSPPHGNRNRKWLAHACMLATAAATKVFTSYQNLSRVFWIVQPKNQQWADCLNHSANRLEQVIAKALTRVVAFKSAQEWSDPYRYSRWAAALRLILMLWISLFILVVSCWFAGCWWRLSLTTSNFQLYYRSHPSPSPLSQPQRHSMGSPKMFLISGLVGLQFLLLVGHWCNVCRVELYLHSYPNMPSIRVDAIQIRLL